jgi:hypothetical protein
MVLMRLRRLPEEATEVARAVAVLGDGRPLPVVAALTDLSEGRRRSPRRPGPRRDRATTEQPLGSSTRSCATRSTATLPAAERGLCHERAAAVLHASRGDDEQVAAHLLLAPPRGDEDGWPC